MAKKAKSIPVNTMANEFGDGIAIEIITLEEVPFADKATADFFAAAKQSHRHDGHSFFLVENGSITIDIDFQTYTITAPSVLYVHPDQVHRTISLQKVTVSSWSVTNENLRAEYLALLEDIAPAKPLVLNKETFSLFFDAVALCIKFAERKNDKLHHSLLKDSCNALVALMISQYLAQEKSANNLSRFDTITKAFKQLLEHNYTTEKRPAAYAKQLNISAPYLNECVKNTTGYSVSHHIQQRVVLEAKRLLYYSDHSVKEIATELGFDDYPYFSRLFTKTTQMTAVAFRNKNHD